MGGRRLQSRDTVRRDPDRIGHCSTGRRWSRPALWLLLLFALLALASTSQLVRHSADPTRVALVQMFGQNTSLGASLLDAYDRAGLPAALHAFCQSRSQLPPVGYCRRKPEVRTVSETVDRADRVVREGFRHGTHGAFPLTAPVDWAADPFGDRSWRFWLNSLEPLDTVISAHAATGDEAYLDFAVGVACDWAEHNPYRVSRNPFAWYDMAVGLRALKLAYLIDAAARELNPDVSDLWTLLYGAWTHAIELAREDTFNRQTNHGLFQAAGLAALARALPELQDSEKWRGIAETRLRAEFQRQFSPDGVHLEHSPGYHLLMTQFLISVLDCQIVDDPGLMALRRKAEDALVWMIAPDGRLPRIGDTDDVVVRRQALGRPEQLQSPELAWVLTEGQRGSPPQETWRVFPDAGYAVFRDWRGAERAGGDEGSYLMLAAGFHSATHKQADDLTLVWHESGSPFIVDAGRYGYYWDEPGRRYCESTCAHNTVEIDGRSTSMRPSDAFGSALTSWGEADGLWFVRAAVERDSLGLRHERTLVYSPHRWLVVIDDIQAGREHRYEQWFHFSPNLSVALAEGGASVRGDDGSAFSVSPLLKREDTALRLVRGQKSPRLQGWTSYRHRQLEPNWALGATLEGDAVVLATLLRLGPTQPVPARASVSRAADGCRYDLAWQVDGKSEGFSLWCPAGAHRKCRLVSATEPLG